MSGTNKKNSSKKKNNLRKNKLKVHNIVNGMNEGKIKDKVGKWIEQEKY